MITFGAEPEGHKEKVKNASDHQLAYIRAIASNARRQYT